MKSDGINRLINKRGTTRDIVNEVSATFTEYWPQTRQLAESLRGANELETCENIFWYVYNNIMYREDPSGRQWVKTPARLVDDGVGDCKSMAIIIASCLRSLDIPAFFRFVAFDKSEQVTHVYVVTQSGIIIDPVERVAGKPRFNYARSYTFNIDMNTTQIYRLSGVEGDNIDFAPKMDDTFFLENTKAMNYLYSCIDVSRALFEVEPTNTEAGNALAMYTVALELYKRSTGNRAALLKAASTLQTLADKGYFNATKNADFAKQKSIVSLAVTTMSGTFNVDAVGEVYQWFVDYVIADDLNNVSPTARATYMRSITPLVGSIQSEKNKLLERMQESAPFFLYLYCSDAFILKHKKNYPQLYVKRLGERQMFTTWVNSCKTFLTQETIYNNLLSGFIKRTGKMPEAFIEEVIAAKKTDAGVGVLSEAMITAIIAGVVAIVTSILGVIATILAASISAPSNYPSSAPHDDDFTLPGSGNGNSQQQGSSSTILIVGAVAFFMILSRKNKKRNVN